MGKDVIKIVAGYTDVSIKKINEDSELVADLKMSSLEVVDAVVAIEDKFGVEFSESEIWDLKTVGDIVDMLEKKLGR